ncbi:MAG: dockerin type I domain-containing protein, partial [Phycisphaerae bacterium]
MSKIFKIAAAVILLNVFCYGDSLWCPDLHTDDFVNLADFAVLANNWDKSGSGLKGDIDGNGTVGPPDLEYLIHYWLKSYECSSADFNLDYKINFKDIASLANLWLTDANSINWDEKYDLD